MFRKFKEWTKKPITWGGYMKFTLIACILSCIYVIGYWIYLFGPSGTYRDKLKIVKDSIRKLFKQY